MRRRSGVILSSVLALCVSGCVGIPVQRSPHAVYKDYLKNHEEYEEEELKDLLEPIVGRAYLVVGFYPSFWQTQVDDHREKISHLIGITVLNAFFLVPTLYALLFEPLNEWGHAHNAFYGGNQNVSTTTWALFGYFKGRQFYGERYFGPDPFDSFQSEIESQLHEQIAQGRKVSLDDIAAELANRARTGEDEALAWLMRTFPESWLETPAARSQRALLQIQKALRDGNLDEVNRILEENPALKSELERRLPAESHER